MDLIVKTTAGPNLFQLRGVVVEATGKILECFLSGLSNCAFTTITPVGWKRFAPRSGPFSYNSPEETPQKRGRTVEMYYYSKANHFCSNYCQIVEGHDK